MSMGYVDGTEGNEEEDQKAQEKKKKESVFESQAKALEEAQYKTRTSNLLRYFKTKNLSGILILIYSKCKLKATERNTFCIDLYY